MVFPEFILIYYFQKGVIGQVIKIIFFFRDLKESVKNKKNCYKILLINKNHKIILIFFHKTHRTFFYWILFLFHYIQTALKKITLQKTMGRYERKNNNINCFVDFNGIRRIYSRADNSYYFTLCFF